MDLVNVTKELLPDGRISTDLKGNMYKGPFHIPRMYMKCAEIIDAINAK